MNPSRHDVVVVGAGGSGLAAALAAREQGARVALLEKNPRPGGSTSWSVGSVTVTGTPHQLARGIRDTPQGHYDDMPGFAGDLAARDNDALRRILCDEVPEAFRWLLAQGVRFHGPMPEPPHRQPRMHTVLPNSGSFIYHLARAARRQGVALFTGRRVTQLVRTQGRVSAVLCDNGERYEASRGVILAAGDFTNDPELKARYMGEVESRVEGVNPTATGDGQKLALALGARIVNGDLALGPELRFIAPARTTWLRRLPPWRSLAWCMQIAMQHVPPAILRPFMMSFLTTALAPSPALFEAGAVLVDRDGRRFCDERDRPAYALPARPDKIGYILLDGALAERFSAWPHFISTAPGIAYAYLDDYRRNRPDVYRQADSLTALARLLSVDARTLAASVGLVEGRCARAPYVALGPVRSVFVHNEGGLAVDTQHRVLGADDAPIEGLYAVGSTGQGGLLLKGHGHHLAWAFVSGRRAGRLVARSLSAPTAA